MCKFQAYHYQDGISIPQNFGDGSQVSYFRFVLQKACYTILPNVGNQDAFGYVEICRVEKKDGRQLETFMEEVCQKVAEQEDKYYYSWIDGEVPEELKKLVRVNIYVLYKNFIQKDWNKPYDQFEKDLKGNSLTDDEKSCINRLPLRIETAEGFYSLKATNSICALYIDSNQDAPYYRYKKIGANYNKRLTCRLKEAPESVNTLNNPGNSYARYARAFIDEIQQGLNDQDKQQINEFSISNKLLDYLGEQQGNQFSENTLPKIYELISSYLKEKIPSLNQQILINANSAALDAACELPSGYYCYYFDFNKTLDSFLSSTSCITTGPGGFGGYAMRASPVNPDGYKWRILSSLGNEKQNLAKLLGYLMDLSNGKMYEGAESASSYLRVNYPVDKIRTPDTPDKKKVSGFQLFEYYKNEMTRIPDLDAKDYKFALDETKFRKKQKGEDKKGRSPKDPTYDRASAGTVMAKALKDYQIYRKMVESPGIVRTNLSATKFSEYVIKNEEKAKLQWQYIVKDIPVKELPPQEWCHLLGHGDGGLEILENFVAGSYHCNTEQLAIEVGLRKVTRFLKNSDVNGFVKVKITAYLMETEGTLRCWPSENVLCAFLKTYTLSSNTQFDSQLESSSGMGPKRIRENYDDEAKRPSKKRKIDPLSYIENHFIQVDNSWQWRIADDNPIPDDFRLYLPIARWMRYKIYVGGKKVFDHVYDGQRWNIDYNECQILDYTVEHAIYQGLENIGNLTIDRDEDWGSEDISGEQKLSPIQYYYEKILYKVAVKKNDEALWTTVREGLKTNHLVAIQNAAVYLVREMQQQMEASR